MHAATAFNLVLVSLIAIIALEVLAKRLRLPPAAALLVGGVAMAFVPGLPHIELDPELVLVVFLPPLLMYGAYFFVWDDFKRNLSGILLLAIGAVAFTTLVVGIAVHLVVPELPWAACFALGAVVSPPDAVAAKAVLERVALPRRLMVLLEGESLLNDAAGLVLFRFALVAAMSGVFSAPRAAASFAGLAVGGVVVGIVAGFIAVRIMRALEDDYLVITTSMLTSWVSYIAGEELGVSSVIATVTCGMVVGWHQHEVFTAAQRMRGTAFWQVVVFVLEALVFVLIGLSLRGIAVRLGGVGDAFSLLGPATAAVIAVVILSRFVWVFGVEAVKWIAWSVTGRKRADADEAGVAVPDWRAATVVSWAGMRGVVTLAVALSLPETMPGRDLILFAGFAVILVTVLLQGATIGPLIALLSLTRGHERSSRHLTEPQAWARMESAQLAAIQPLVHDADGNVIHPRLLEQYTYRAGLTQRFRDMEEFPTDARHAHYDVVLAAIAAGRAELLRMHRSGEIHDELLHSLEHDLDLQEIIALHSRG
ncbi:Na+/H+ antiporter membrane protein [Caballeronia turbans]|jgi:CPA1 family monovalent cation:H+ antiporter|uniref:Na+/H+ antiporter n=1 Tax=unclassified Caballeronia TaxID=2646786 RepID=UPI00074C4A6D|nr:MULTISPECIES: Na+/H+ antiporter [unclassified Caballeronia]SAL11512.1 Na+/H+ antiporter membrane protein [Caballeronia turbans]